MIATGQRRHQPRVDYCVLPVGLQGHSPDKIGVLLQKNNKQIFWIFQVTEEITPLRQTLQ
ncbi:MAG: hypothetical protein A3F83_07870 [Candidatus Glassbacteria bacterium RIFCSPLOWO2_12_FULL_58_11]|uniref:Uncharacterized protein n=1 Tax=Candidatus Glassbacteria bacterium RIFCSPLOWO2_12_FULL_58_11 TaxID=1817867 RepID=A0A1F5YZX9_9BACT|nr:MAG: hypothetical protein A3F83_07870 [Candidatus Glassbacteria bacterium RIFCSPLOWO2_12_FULL_58_11]